MRAFSVLRELPCVHITEVDGKRMLVQLGGERLSYVNALGSWYGNCLLQWLGVAPIPIGQELLPS